jgi:Transglutaminase-like superfamily
MTKKLIIIGIIISSVIIAFVYFKKEKPNYDIKNRDLLNEVKIEKLPSPPTIIYEVSMHKKEIIAELTKKCNYSGNKDELATACDYKNVRNIGVILAGNSEGDFNIGQICEIWDYCRKKWKYVNDPVTSYVSSASNTIKADYSGDCDDFAVLTCSLILSIGGETRINYAKSKDCGHAFTEVNIGKTDLGSLEHYLGKRYKMSFDASNKLNYRIDREGNKWLNLDWFSKYPGGQYFNFVSGTTYYVLHNYCENF